MASTRNKNTPGNYQLEQFGKLKQADYLTYIHSQSGRAAQTHFPGNGLLSGRYAPTELSYNPSDIESFLYGIGSTNLVTPLEQPIAQIKQLQTLNIMDKTPLILPNPLVIEPHQRPRPL